jgi:hypothetical protein
MLQTTSNYSISISGQAFSLVSLAYVYSALELHLLLERSRLVNKGGGSDIDLETLTVNGNFHGEDLTTEEVTCACDAPRVSRIRGKRQVVSRLQRQSLSLFSFHAADDGNGSHGERQNISPKNRTLALR